MLWSYVSEIYNFLCSPCVVNSHPTHDEVIKFVSEICDRFSPGTTVSSTNKTDHHDITEILLKMSLNTITLTLTHINIYIYFYIVIIIIWNGRGHECSRIWKLSADFTLIQVHQNSVDIFGPRYVGDDFFRVESSVVQSNSRSFLDLKS